MLKKRMKLQMNNCFLFHEQESNKDFWVRVLKAKNDLGLEWNEVAEFVNDANAYSLTGENCRKRCAYWVNKADLEVEMPETLVKERHDQIQEDLKVADDISQSLLELQKLKVKVSDERNQTRAYIRQLSREDTLKEIAHELVEKIDVSNPLPECICNSDVIQAEKFEGILLLSDWHYGIEIDSRFNQYNPDIARTRIQRLLQQTIKYCKDNDIQHLHVLNLGDLISGRIHLQLRIENRYDIIEQTIHATAIVDKFITTLVENGIEVDYYDCLDNHSRIEPNKKDSINLESMTRIMHWFLQERYKDYQNVQINDNFWSDDIIDLNVLGHHVGAVHGHLDKVNSVVNNLTLLTKNSYDLICTAHMHHFSADEQNQCVVVSNPSLMGTDNYAQDLRLTSKPAQVLIKVSYINPCDEIKKINL